MKVHVVEKHDVTVKKKGMHPRKHPYVENGRGKLRGTFVLIVKDWVMWATIREGPIKGANRS